MGSGSEWIAWGRKVLDCLPWRGRPQAALAAGARAERLAEATLRRHGARILARNARYRGGEIDLIAEHEGYIAFVEVRLRTNGGYGSAADSITLAKQRRIVLAARHWLQEAGHAHRHRSCRFDAVLLDRLDPPRIEWLKAAFDAPPR